MFFPDGRSGPLLIATAVIICGFVGCSKRRYPAENSETPSPSKQNEISFSTQQTVSVRRLDNGDLGYLLSLAEIVAESPRPDLLPRNFKYAYRVIGVTEQGNCVPACPRSIILIAISNFSDYRDGHIRLYRIDGVRFWHFRRVEEFKPEETNGYFLSFRFNSIPHPQQPEQYIAKIGFDYAIAESGPAGIPKPAHRFSSFLQRKSGDVFRITFRKGDVFRVWNFQPQDPSIVGDDDAWTCDVKEAISEQNWKGVGGGIGLGFRESEVLQILDEQSGRIVFKRELWEP